MAAQHAQQIAEAVATILRARLWQPAVGIVLGSGLGDLAQRLQHPVSIPYCDIPHFCPTSAVGHVGCLVSGYLGGLPVVLLQGRVHRYEGIANHHAAFPIHCLYALGARCLVTTNAAGGLNQRYRPGDLMVIDSHIDFLWARRQWCGGERGGQSPVPPRTPPYDWDWIRAAQAIARRRDIVLHQGCYLGTLGPTYETRSEYRMFRWCGADAVGMSTIPEVLAASSLGMRVAAFSVITNVASTDVPHCTTHDEVVAAGRAAGPQLMDIIEDLLSQQAGPPD